MKRLSLITFSRNDIDKSLGLIDYIYDLVDDIVLVDSSNEKEWKRLNIETKKRNLGKLRLFHALALGYPEPLFMYAYGKCKNDWVLYLDSDERLSKALKTGIKKLISNTKADAFTIKRYEEVANGNKTSFFTWQVHLSKRQKTFYKGLLHEQPLIKGRINEIGNEDYYIEHVVELMMEHRIGLHQYNKLEKFERFSYKLYNEKVLSYISKMMNPKKEKDIRKTTLGRFVYSILRFYEMVAFRKDSEEISNFDYFFFYLMKDLVYRIKEGNIREIITLFPDEVSYLNQRKAWRNESDGEEIFKISQIINKIGITKFLGLDSEGEIIRLTNKYRNKTQGIELLMRLLKERYRSMKGLVK